MRLISEKQCAEILDDFRNVPLASFDHPDRVLATLCSKVPHVTTFNQALLRRHYDNNVDIMKWDFEQKGFPIEITEGKHESKEKGYIVRLVVPYGEGVRQATEDELKAVQRSVERNRNKHSAEQKNNSTRERKRVQTHGGHGYRQHYKVVAVTTRGDIAKEFDTIEECQAFYKFKRLPHVYDIIKQGKYSRSVNGYLRWGD